MDDKQKERLRTKITAKLFKDFVYRGIFGRTSKYAKKFKTGYYDRNRSYSSYIDRYSAKYTRVCSIIR